MATDLGQIIRDLINSNPKEPDFTDDEYYKLIEHFRNEEYNQFYCSIICKVFEKKKSKLSKEELITSLTAILSDKIGNGFIKEGTDEDIISLIIDVYNILFLIDIEEIHRNRF